MELINKSYIGWDRFNKSIINSHQDLETYRASYDMGSLDFYDRYIPRESWLYNKRILDLGCFVGGKTQLFSESGAKEVVGIDLSKRGIKIAKKYENEKLKYYRTSSTELKKEYKGYFDTIISFTVFEHIQKELLPTVIDDCYELLSKNGICIIVYNFFYDKYGAHVEHCIYHPFPQFLFQKQHYLEYCDKRLEEFHKKGLYGYFPLGYSYCKNTHNEDCYMELNRLISFKFKKLLRESKFKKIEDFQYSRSEFVKLLFNTFPKSRLFESSHFYILYK
ncbi:MAG: methyltransferase domain-containing protein [bacterium]